MPNSSGKQSGIIETEVKFSVPDKETFDALKSLEQLNGFKLESVGTKTNLDRYLDTAGRRLLQAGYACRVRNQKDKFVLTLKSLTPASDGVHQRQEIESEVPGQTPALWPQSEAKFLLEKITQGEPLELLFPIYQVRHKYLVFYNEQPIIEFSLDEVFQDKQQQAGYLELEAELINNGRQAELAEFARLLQAEWPLQPESVSKFERMYAITFGQSIDPL
jgi:triphosphatase